MKKQYLTGIIVSLVNHGSFALFAALASSRCGAGTLTFGNTNVVTINDSSQPFRIVPATPYPSIINVSGFPPGETIEKVTVTLHNLGHGTPDDIDILLVGPGGQNVIILSDAGGGFADPEVPITITLDDAAASEVPDNGPDEGSLASGTYRPGNFDEDTDVFPAPAPAPSPATTLAAFAGTNPNGDWQLYLVDDDVFDGGSIANGWSLTIVSAALPPPTASPFNTLHDFTAGTGLLYTNSDGASPQAALILSGGALYGTAMEGGNSGNGTVFKVNAGGSGWTTLHHFAAASGAFPSSANSDGAYPVAGLVLSGDTLYGTAVEGGNTGHGTVYKVNTDGTNFTTLHNFTAAPDPSYTNVDGAHPYGGVIVSGDALYGTAAHGGDSGGGTVFKVNTDGTGFTVLHHFSSQSAPSDSNSDGANPYAELVLSAGILYGTATNGGNANKGTVFSIRTDGTGFTTLHHFSGASDGANPRAGLILSGNRLYGTAPGGGIDAWGTVFGVNINGGEFANLHGFTGGGDGGAPNGLIEFENMLCGTSANGGTAGRGTVFQVTTSGGGFSVLYSFTAQSLSLPYTNTDGAEPKAGLVLSGQTLYGTASQGGSAGSGTIFSLSLPPSFEAWATRFGLSGAAAASDADPDADGLANAAEYILGGNPTMPSASGRPAATAGSGNLLFTFARDDSSETTDVTLTVEAGTDLQTWPNVFNVGSNTANSSAGVGISENGTAPDTITVTIPMGSAQTMFFRIKVSITP